MRLAPALSLLLGTGCLSVDTLVPPTVDEDPSLPTLAVPGSLLHGEVVGDPDDPLVVLLHGGPGADLVGMRRQLALADHGFQVLIYDQRGAGRSRRHDVGAFDRLDLVDELAALIADHSPDGTAALIGHSWGGQLAAMAVQELGDTVTAVVFVEPGPWTDERLAGMGLTSIDMTAAGLNDVMWLEQVVSPADHARLDLRFLELMSRQTPGYRMSTTDPMPFHRMGYVGWMNGAGTAPDAPPPDFDLVQGIEDWSGTAHFIWGSANEIMDADYRAAQEAPWPERTRLVVEGVGHDVHWVEADAVNAHILEVL